MSETINIIDLGLRDYQSVLTLQENTHNALFKGEGCDTVFIVEHPSVITLGARSSANKLTKDAETIKQAGIEIFQIRRGGGATAHNPGQLVVYPIINLKKRNLGVSDFVHLLEKIGIDFLAEIGVHACTKKGYPGLWIEDEKPRINTNEHEFKTNFLNSVNPCPWLKIASIGVQVKKWITFHGIAININNDLSIFDLIIPCGIDNIKMTSVQKESNKKVNMEKVKIILKDLLLKNL